MKQLLKLTIPKPCSQDWNEMSRTDTGRFCDSCKKHVTDFTNFSEQQLKEYFSKANGNVCGNFSPDQLDRFLITQDYKKRRNFLPQLLVSAALTIGLESKAEALKHSGTLQVNTVNKLQPERKFISTSSSSDSSRYISGRILDYRDNAAISFVTISVKGVDHQVTSDINGNFIIAIPDTFLTKEITLLFTIVGYTKKEIQLLIPALPITTEVYLTKNDLNLKGAVTFTELRSKPSLWYRLFHKKKKQPECD